jgi:hypothetical protein
LEEHLGVAAMKVGEEREEELPRLGFSLVLPIYSQI